MLPKLASQASGIRLSPLRLLARDSATRLERGGLDKVPTSQADRHPARGGSPAAARPLTLQRHKPASTYHTTTPNDEHTVWLKLLETPHDPLEAPIRPTAGPTQLWVKWLHHRRKMRVLKYLEEETEDPDLKRHARERQNAEFRKFRMSRALFILSRTGAISAYTDFQQQSAKRVWRLMGMDA